MAPKLHQMIDAISEELVKCSNGIKLFTRLGMEHVTVTHQFHQWKNVKKAGNARMITQIVGFIMVSKMVIAGNFNHK